MARQRKFYKHDEVDVLDLYRGVPIPSTDDNGATEIFYDDHVVVDEISGIRTAHTARDAADEDGTQQSDPDDGSAGDILDAYDGRLS